GGHWSYGDESFPETGVTFFAGTFVRHPLALAATLAVLENLKASGPQLQQQLTRKNTRLGHTPHQLFAQKGVPTKIESFGSIFYFSFPTDLRFGTLFYYHMREQGIHIQEGFPCCLTTAHSDEDIARIIQAFKESIWEMQAGEVMPAPASSALQPRDPKPIELSHDLITDAVKEAPLTEAQMEIWLSAQLGSEASCSYNESFSMRFTGELNESALRDSLQEIVDRHDALRLRFSPAGDRLLFGSRLKLDVPLRDFSAQEPSSREDELRRLIDEDSRTPFDLVEGPLVRAILVK